MRKASEQPERLDPRDGPPGNWPSGAPTGIKLSGVVEGLRIGEIFISKYNDQ
jgi:hypothetical protein